MTEHVTVLKNGLIEEMASDPSLLLAFGTGTLLTGFLVTAHACCFGFAAGPLSDLLQICSSSG